MVVVGLQQIAACCVGGEIEMRCVVSWERWGGREHITRVVVAGGRRHACPRRRPPKPRRSIACAPPSPEEDAEIERG